MRIVCPSCAAEYDVPTARLTPRKMVRCARCGGEWEPAAVVAAGDAEPARDHHPEAEAEAEPPVASPRLAATGRPAAPLAPPGWRTGLGAAWVLTFVVVAGAVAATVVWREQVIRAWPPSSRILATFGQMPPKSAQTEGIKAK